MSFDHESLLFWTCYEKRIPCAFAPTHLSLDKKCKSLNQFAVYMNNLVRRFKNMTTSVFQLILSCWTILSIWTTWTVFFCTWAVFSEKIICYPIVKIGVRQKVSQVGLNHIVFKRIFKVSSLLHLKKVLIKRQYHLTQVVF